jgi:MFS family permease
LLPVLVAFFLGGIALWVPVEKLFLSEIGFTPQTVGLMAAVYAALVPIVEVPSGILADRWSRRSVLIVGNVGAFLSVLIGGLSADVATYLVAALLLGVYFAMQSGTFDALVYDTVLEETGSSSRFETVLGRLRLAESAALVLGALGGGVLAALTSTRATYFATLPFLAASTIAFLAFREPRLHEDGERRPLRAHLSVTYGTLRHDVRLLPIAALLLLAALLTQAVFEFGPLWLVDLDSGAGLFGPAWALLMASLGLGGALGGRIRFDAPGTLTVVLALLASCSAVLITVHQVWVVTGAQVVLATLMVAMSIFLTRLLHDAIPSNIRSGVASTIGAATWSAFLPFALLFGAVSERFGVHVGGWLFGVVTAATAVLLVRVVVTHRREGPPARSVPRDATGAVAPAEHPCEELVAA